MAKSRWSFVLSLFVFAWMVATGATARAADEPKGGLGLSPQAQADAAQAAAAAQAEGELQLPATPEKGIVRLTLKTDNRQIQLKRHVATIMTSQTTGLVIQEVLCIAPCGVVVDGRKGEQFYFGGMNVIASDSFQLLDYSGNVEATVKEGSHGAFWGAVWGITLGAAAAIGGITWAALGDWKWGLATGAVGVGMVVGGWVLYDKAGKTTVEFRPLPAN